MRHSNLGGMRFTMNKYVKNAIKMGAFGLILLLLIGLLGIYYAPTVWFPRNRILDRTSRFASIELEEPGSLEVVTIGDSLSNMDFTPMELWRNYGYTSYNAGSEGQTVEETYYMLKKVFQTQSPKVILMEGELIFRGGKSDRIQSTLAQEIYSHLPGLRFHNLWKRHFDPEGVRIFHRGYCVNGAVAPYEGDADYLACEKEWLCHKPTAFMDEYFSKIKELCEKNGAELIVFAAPSPKNYDQKRVDALAEITERHGFTFIDLNSKIEEIGIDWAEDTSDHGDHMNVKGAKKVTLYFGKYLSENFDLTDRRADANFVAWNDELQPYDQLVKDMDGIYFGVIERERYGVNWDNVLQ